MGIELRQPGEAKAAATAGAMIGGAERAKEERARTERQTEQAQQIAAQQAARQMAQEWEIQKMLLNSQQDFAHEQRLRQADLDQEARAKEWDTEKMELASRIDFESQERGRQKEYDEFLTTEKYIRDKETSGDLSKEKAEDLYFMNAYQHSKLNKPEIIARLGGNAEYIQRMKTGRSGEESALKTLFGGDEDDTVVKPPPHVWVYAPTGKLAQIPFDQLEEAVAKGAKLAPGQQLPKSPAFQEAQTQWMIEQQLLKGDKEYIIAELDNAYKAAYNKTIDPRNPFANLAAQSKIADIRKKYPAYFEEYHNRPEGRF